MRTYLSAPPDINEIHTDFSKIKIVKKQLQNMANNILKNTEKFVINKTGEQKKTFFSGQQPNSLAVVSFRPITQ